MNVSEKTPLRICCLSDGLPGHFNQTRGMVMALEKGFAVELVWLEIKLRFKPLRKLLCWMLNVMPERTAGLVAKAYKFSLPHGRPDLVLSAGGNTSYLNIALAQQFGCRNFFIGSLRGLRPERFTRVFTIEAIGSANNIVMALAPAAIDPQAVVQAGAPLREASEQPLYTLLVGGATAEYQYLDEEWRQLAEQMNRIARQQQIRWLVTTSRRTGAKVETLLRNGLDPAVVADTTWYCDEPRKVMMAYLGAATAVFCTEDSLSMLTEAIYSGHPVISLYPQRCRPAQRYKAALDRLESSGMIHRRCVQQIFRWDDVDPARHLDRLHPLEQLWQAIAGVMDKHAVDDPAREWLSQGNRP